MRKKSHYKFTKKRHSKRGMLACFLAAASIFALIYMIMTSFWQQGKSSVYLGSAGILALAVALAAVIEAIKSLKEDDTFRGIPAVSMVLSILAAGGWIAIYAVGFMI